MAGFFKLPGIRGGSQDPLHAGWSEIDSMSWMSEEGPVPSSNRRSGLHSMVISKRVDAASPEIYKAVASGRHFDSAAIELTKGAAVYVSLQLTDVLLTDIHGWGATDEKSGPGESLNLEFEGATAMRGGSASAMPIGRAVSSASAAMAAAIVQAIARVAKGP